MGETMNMPEQEQVLCGKCGHVMQIGDYPFCPHFPVRERPALQGDPTVVFYNPRTGKYRLPGSSDSPTPDGYERQVLTTDRERAQFERKLNAEESAKLRQHWYERRAEKEATMAESARLLKERYKVAGPGERRLIDAAFKNMEKEAGRMAYEAPRDAGFQVRVRHYNGRDHWED